jgi:hypothetical protein
MRLPDFIIVGAMKCGTSGLHDQLARRSGLFLSNPKEPNFFSDDDVYRRGLDWYADLFAGARAGQLCGESSTHYTKLPTHPRSCDRMRALLPGVKLVYVMRHPIDRIISQYIHQWTENDVCGPLDEAVTQDERFIAYSRYATQLEPYLDAYGPGNVLPVFFEQLVAQPDAELSRIVDFIGDHSPEAPCWASTHQVHNASSDRIRRSPLRDLARNTPLGPLWRRVVSHSLRERIKSRWQLKDRPTFSPEALAEVQATLDSDLSRLGGWLGRTLTCADWRQQVGDETPEWAPPAPGREFA